MNHIFHINGYDNYHAECFACGTVKLHHGKDDDISGCTVGPFKHHLDDKSHCTKCSKYVPVTEYKLEWRFYNSPDCMFFVDKYSSALKNWQPDVTIIIGCAVSDDEITVKDILT